MTKVILTLFVAGTALLAQSTSTTKSTAGTSEPTKGSAINGTQGIHTTEDAKGDVYQSNNTVAPGQAKAHKHRKRGSNNGDTSGSASTRANEHSNASVPH